MSIFQTIFLEFPRNLELSSNHFQKPKLIYRYKF